MTSRYVYGDDERLIGWSLERIKHCGFRDDAVAIGHERDGELVGVVVYDSFTPGSCFISAASDGKSRWMTREFCIRMMAYPFLQCGFGRLNAMVSANNEPSLRLVRHFGFVQEGLWREAGLEGEDTVMFGLLRRECRFLPKAAAGKMASSEL